MLSSEAKRLRRELAKEYGIKDAAGVAILRTALEAFDRMRGIEAQIGKDGLTTKDRWGQTKGHPLLSAERDARGQFLGALKQLNLDLEPLKGGPGRPAGDY